jgi:hypothetical protein
MHVDDVTLEPAMRSWLSFVQCRRPPSHGFELSSQRWRFAGGWRLPRAALLALRSRHDGEHRRCHTEKAAAVCAFENSLRLLERRSRRISGEMPCPTGGITP